MSITERLAPTFSIVVPAHDEATVIERCLRFVADLDRGEAEIVVVANGCSDDTAHRAQGFPGVRVIERSEPSKVGALNAGDAACAAFPRVYLDADITVSAAALRAVAARLAGPEALVAAPRMQVELAGRPAVVQRYYRAFLDLPYAANALVGNGFYALSAAGRARFDTFPELTADDLFVARHFADGERIVVADETFTMQAPGDLASLLKVRTRVAAGNTQLTSSDMEFKESGALRSSTGSTAQSLATLCLHSPGRTPDAATYVLVTALARWRARRTATDVWLRDASTR